MKMKFNTDRIRIVALYIFIFSLGFENWDPVGIASFFTITKMTGLLYAILSVVNFQKNFPLEENRQIILTILILWFWVVLISIINIWNQGTIDPFLSSFLQVIVLFWLITNDMRRFPGIKKYIVLAFIFGMSSIALMIPFGIGVELGVNVNEISRLEFFGMNPNKTGQMAAIGILLLVSVIIKRDLFFGKRGLLLLLLLPGLITLVGLSGSRGAFITLFLGLFVLLIMFKTSFLKKTSLLVLGFLVGLLMVNSLLEFETLNTRLITTIEYQNTGDRLEIWQKAIDIYKDYPIFGVGATGYEREMITRYIYYQDTHNVFIYVLVTGGVFGIILYLAFYTLLFRKVYILYKREKQSINIAIFVVLSFLLMKSGGILVDKLTWILLAFISTPMKIDKAQ